MFSTTRTSLMTGLALLAGSGPSLAAQAAPTPLTLGDAARLAARESPSAVAARERAIQTGARSIARRAELLPALNSEALIDGGSASPFGFGSTVPTTTGASVNGRTVDMRVRVTQTVFDLGAWRRWKSAAAETEAAGASAYAAAEAAAENGALAYLRVQRAQARLSARLADSALAAELLGIARQQLSAGTAIALDVTRAESQLASSVSQLITGRSERARAELDLLRLLGLAMTSRVSLTDSLSPPLPGESSPPEAMAVQTAFSRRGDLLAAAASMNAARRQVSAVRAERLPSVSVFGSAGSSSDGVLDSHAYGIQVSLPIFDGFGREARVAEGSAREREVEAQARDTRLRVEVEVRTALIDLGAAKEQVGAAEVQLRLAEAEVAQARERFRAGVAGNADVINASLTLNRARDLVVDALADFHLARVGLAAAQGVTAAMR